MKIKQKWAGGMFGLAVFLAVAAPVMFSGKKVAAYSPPEATPLSSADLKVVMWRSARFCDAGLTSTPEAKPTSSAAAKGAIEVPVFLYHRITTADKPSHEVIRPDLFEAHMRYLKSQGYQTVTSEEVRAHMEGRGGLPQKPVMLTFDDGWQDNMEAAKLLKELDFGATFYVISGFFGIPMYFTEDDVRELIKNPKFEIGSHTHSHFVKWDTKLHTLPLCTIAQELAASKLLLERLTQRPVTSLAWPYGYNTNEAIFAAGQLGYTTTGLVSLDSHNAPGNSPLFMRRMNIDGTCPLSDFQTMLEKKKLKECS